MAAHIPIPLLLVHLIALAAGVIFLRSDAFADRPEANKKLIGLLMAAAVSTFAMSISEPSYWFSDFRKAYQVAGKAILEGPNALAPLIGGDTFIDKFVNLPIVAYLFAPFGVISSISTRGTAALFALLGFGMSLWAWFLLCREAKLDDNRSWLLLFLFAANGPLIYSSKEGNTSQMVLLGLVAALALLRARRDVVAGVLLGFCALIKLPLLIFGAYFVARRNWWAALGFSAFLGVSGLLSLLIFGWELNWTWYESSILKFNSHAIGAYNVQSILGFLLRLENGEQLLGNWSLVAITEAQRLIGRGVAMVIIVAAVLVCARRPIPCLPAQREEWNSLEFCIVVVLAILASPLSWTHYYCWLLIPIAFFLRERSMLSSRPPARWAGWTVVALISPVAAILSFPEHSILQAVYMKVVVSNYLAGALLMYGLLLWALAKGLSSGLRASSREAIASARGP
jgi:alpha-1,2-mannosyltransferase